MRTVWKHTLGPGPITTIDVTCGARIVHVDVQLDLPRVWVDLDPEAHAQQQRVWIVGTGGAVPEGAEHVGSFLVDGGMFVFHVYAETTPFEAPGYQRAQVCCAACATGPEVRGG